MSSFGTSFPGCVHDWLVGEGGQNTALVTASMAPEMAGRSLGNTTLGTLLSVGVGHTKQSTLDRGPKLGF